MVLLSARVHLHISSLCVMHEKGILLRLINILLLKCPIYSLLKLFYAVVKVISCVDLQAEVGSTVNVIFVVVPGGLAALLTWKVPGMVNQRLTGSGSEVHD